MRCLNARGEWMEIIVGSRVRPKRRMWRIFWATTASVLVLLAAVTARVFVWPDLRPLPDRADAIIELAGPGEHSRDQVALDLARQNRAPLLIQSTLPDDTNCLRSVPGVTVECFHPDPDTTRGEARYIGQLAAQHHWTSVILVTTPDQVWRARLRVSRCFDGEIYSVTAHLPFLMWFQQIPYQWVASVKALTIERDC
jgi:uncharacterized SAM-binding protein YcdF (DUF218 family)